MSYINTMTVVDCYIKWCEENQVSPYPQALFEILCDEEASFEFVTYMYLNGYEGSSFQAWSQEVITENNFNKFVDEINQCFRQLLK